ncbi:Tox-REase-5 domain-containing protein [Jannaschia marina]|uniref:Tox-REase-5 domain-containing protein n=1 Tax=Jannaschia marina TaxID=2741674 RepID=UPI0015CE9F5A|nr:Tox-REase-5 domain-containing protein [Jannaschia marina]
MAARQALRAVMRRAAQQAASQAARTAYQAAVAAGTLAPEDYTDVGNEHADAQARANALAREMEAACAADPARCEACEANRGSPVAANWNMSARAAAYQQFITGFPRGVEYAYNGVTFDGFWRSVCTLVEAKDNYSHLLNVETSDGGLFSDPEIKSVDWSGWVLRQPIPAGEVIKNEFDRQNAAARPRPPVQLQWHCAQISLVIVLSQELEQTAPPASVIYTPNPIHPDPHAGFIK